MKNTIAALLLILAPSIAAAGGGDMIGIGYVAKADGAKVYERSEGPAVDQELKKGFPLVAFENASIWSGGAMASEAISNGRAHVRYWKNGKDANDGENTAWIDPKEFDKFQFDCCGDKVCSGIKAPLFKTRTYTDCFNQGAAAAIEKKTAVAENSAADLEKLKLQLEIEKLKLEQEKLKASGAKP